jgi:hypothetical protein
MKTSMFLAASVLALTGCGGAVETNTAAKSADGLNWPVCFEWIESTEVDGKMVKAGELICAADESELNASTPQIKAALAARHSKVEFHTVPVQK